MIGSFDGAEQNIRQSTSTDQNSFCAVLSLPVDSTTLLGETPDFAWRHSRIKLSGSSRPLSLESKPPAFAAPLEFRFDRISTTVRYCRLDSLSEIVLGGLYGF